MRIRPCNIRPAPGRFHDPGRWLWSKPALAHVPGVGGRLGGLWFYQLEGVASRGSGLPVGTERNRVLNPAFALVEEGDRPVFVAPEFIDEASGLVSPGAWQRDSTVGFVRELSRSGRSRSVQIIARVDGFLGASTITSLSYTFTRTEVTLGDAPVSGFSAGSAALPDMAPWASAPWERRHAIQFVLSQRLGENGRASLISRVSSGIRYTPMVSGDINGDWLHNDRAFVFDPMLAPDSSVSRGLTQQIARGVGGGCLGSQIGRVAAPSSCTGPWSFSLDARLELRPWQGRRARRLAVSAIATNISSLLDQLIHGERGVRGWGESTLVDDRLLTPRRFDRATGAFRYEINDRFGQPVALGRSPFAVRLTARVALGRDPVAQTAINPSSLGAELRSSLFGRVRNVPELILRLDSASPGLLGLSPEQRSQLEAAADGMRPVLFELVGRLAEELGRPGEMTASRRAVIEDLAETLRSGQREGVASVRRILAPEQWAAIPEWVVQVPAAGELEQPHFEASSEQGFP